MKHTLEIYELFIDPDIAPTEKALRVIALYYGDTARRRVEWRAKNYPPGWANEWPRDLETALDYHEDRETYYLYKRIVGQDRASIRHEIKAIEDRIDRDRDDLVPFAQVVQQTLDEGVTA